MLTFNLQILRIIRRNSGRMLMIRQRHQPNRLAPTIRMLSYRESRSRARRAAGVVTVVIARASSADVIVSDEPRLNAIQKGFQVQEAGRDDAKTLDGLCANCHGPRVVF